MGLDYSDVRPSYFNLELREECSRTLGLGIESSKRNQGAAVKSNVIGEQQLKRTQSGSSSRSGRDREQQLKWMQAASSRRNRGAAAEAKGEQQLKWMLQSGPGAAAEADAIGEQLCSLHRELSSAGLRTVGERRGSS